MRRRGGGQGADDQEHLHRHHHQYSQRHSASHHLHFYCVLRKQQVSAVFICQALSISNCVSCRKRKQSRPFLTYTEAQFTRLAEAKLYHYQREQRELREKHIGGRGEAHPGKCDNVYVKMSDISTGSSSESNNNQPPERR